jgi:hypothetical protein
MTTSTDIAVIPTVDAEIVEPQLLNKTEAKRLDKKIRTAADKTVKSNQRTLELFDELKGLVAEAKTGEIHKALGLKSWPAYLADAVHITVAARDDRKAVTQWLSGEGMSQRAIGAMLGVGFGTVNRDLDGQEVEDGATVTSLDGAQRPRNGKAKDEEAEEEPLDVESEEIPDEPMKAVDIVSSFNDEMANLVAAQGELTYLAGEDKWAGARKRVTNANLNNLGDVIHELQLIVDDLMGDSS